jgi:hypothetical protein|tara:strand:+ start:2630 stop:3310 length:681 start_codon:yes stop_codon:yes gene_type:complete
MATNAYFRNHDNVYEQNLIDDLVIESIKIYGLDVKFITRLHQNIDKLLNEDDLPTFDKYYDFEVYIKNVDGFEGEGDFLSKFGLQIRDSITFTVAIRTFEQFVTREDDTRKRPLEGEMIWMPLNQKMYKIQHVEHESVFYQSGALQVYDMRCELAEYSGETFDTGVPEIDHFFDDIDTSANTVNTLTALSGVDPLSQNFDFEDQADDILDFSEMDPFSENISIQDS